MPRFDKVEPLGGSFRAPLNFTPVGGDVGVVIPVTLNGSGRVIKTTAGTECCGVICLSSLNHAAGDVVDVMTDGEIVDMTGLAAGTRYYAGVGVLGTTNTNVKIGWTVEAWRLIVRLGR
jgi:hypothetical protein